MPVKAGANRGQGQSPEPVRGRCSNPLLDVMNRERKMWIIIYAIRGDNGAGLDSTHLGGVQVIHGQPPERIAVGRRRASIGSSDAWKAGQEGSCSVFYVLAYFRKRKMDDLSITIGDLIGNAANKGTPAGRIRKDVVAWCMANITNDSSAVQIVIRRFLRDSLNTRLVSYDKSSLVQAVAIKELAPNAQRPGSCACWKRDIQECGLCEYSAKDVAFIAGIHFEAAKKLGGKLPGVGITIQYDGKQQEEIMAVVAGLLFKLYKIIGGLLGLGVRQRMVWSDYDLIHHKILLVELRGEPQEVTKVVNIILLTWRPFLGGTCGIPERALPNRVFISMPTQQEGSFLMACTEAGNFKESEVIKNVYLPAGEFPMRTYPEGTFRASVEEPLIQSLASLMEGVDDVLERTRAQMQTSRRFLKKMGVLQGDQGLLLLNLLGTVSCKKEWGVEIRCRYIRISEGGGIQSWAKIKGAWQHAQSLI